MININDFDQQKVLHILLNLQEFVWFVWLCNNVQTVYNVNLTIIKTAYAQEQKKNITRLHNSNYAFYI